MPALLDVLQSALATTFGQYSLMLADEAKQQTALRLSDSLCECRQDIANYRARIRASTRTFPRVITNEDYFDFKTQYEAKISVLGAAGVTARQGIKTLYLQRSGTALSPHKAHPMTPR
jgi:hypothetical protein